MKVLIVGATGGIGEHAVKHALKKGYDVTVFVRNAQKIADHKQLTVIEGELNDSSKVRSAVKGQDAVIWCVGIPLKRNYDTMFSLEGHKVWLNIMEEEGVDRLIDWGTPSIPFKEDKKSLITIVPTLLAEIFLKKAKQEMMLIADLIVNSQLDWTIVRFLQPKDTNYSGKVIVGFGDKNMRFAISRADIGAFMVEQVEDSTYSHSMPIIGS